MTRTERLRFIRSYYQHWGMKKLDPDTWQSRLGSMTLKQLYHLHEISKSWLSVVGVESRQEPVLLGAINKGRSKERVVLSDVIWQHITHVYQRVHSRDPEPIWVYESCEGSSGFVALWDHWQASLKQVVCGLPPIDPYTKPSFEKQYLLGDSSDEELQT